jgi:hypothetical protein
MRLWRAATLDAAKPRITEWRERDQAEHERRELELDRKETADKARRAGMRKGKALTTSKVREALGCSLAELNRWADDGRLPPDGELVLGNLPKAVYARAWLPSTVEGARSQLQQWRERDNISKIAGRRKPRIIV